MTEISWGIFDLVHPRAVAVLDYQGIDTVVIVYRNQNDGLVSEILRFDGDLVIEGHGTYIVAP
jgi:hypothetical protein